jgi:hypothetical protein
MEEHQLLIAISRIIGTVKVQDDPFGFTLLIPPDIHLKKLLCHPVEILRRYRILKP